MEYKMFYEEQLKKLQTLQARQNNESNLYILNDDVLKILYTECLTEYRKIIIQKLSQLEDPTYVTPKYMIENEKGIFLGYAMQYYKDYQTIHNYNLYTLSLEERKIIAHNICKKIKELTNLGFLYLDLHNHNFLIKGTDIKIVDMDGCKARDLLLYKDIGKTYFENMLCDIENYLSTLIMQILFGINIDLTINLSLDKQKKLISKSKENLKKFYTHSFEMQTDLSYNCEEYIDLFDETTIDDAKMILRLL